MGQTKADLHSNIVQLEEEVEALQRELKMERESYVLVEISDRNFCIGKPMVGKDRKYNFIATCRNRVQAENLLGILNANL